jgi:hypothetical protein
MNSRTLWANDGKTPLAQNITLARLTPMGTKEHYTGKTHTHGNQGNSTIRARSPANNRRLLAGTTVFIQTAPL